MSTQKLNPEQLQAVEYIDGPLLVAAGPGTGKTQLLSERVAHILKVTDTDPQSILCLTFTNNAAVNMRNRLGKIIGLAAQKVVIETFHAFAGSIMSEYPEKFWEGAELVVAEETEQLAVLREVLTELPAASPLALKAAGRRKAINRVKDAVQLLAEAALTPQKLLKILDANLHYIEQIEPLLPDIVPPRLTAKLVPKLLEDIARLPDLHNSDSLGMPSLSTILYNQLAYAIQQDAPTNKTKYTGDWKKKWFAQSSGSWQMHSERKSIEYWRAIADVYGKYRHELMSRGFYDYNDMILGVIEALQTDQKLLEQVQEKFLYVMVDEFQDTNKAQMAMINLVVSHPSNEGKPNIMVVGDDDQAIYAFNGADLSNILDFTTVFPTTKVIALTQNYRSTQAVLDNVKPIIEQASDRLIHRVPGMDKTLVAQRVLIDSNIKRLSYPTKEHQLYELIEHVAAYQTKNTDASVAVLANTRKDMEQLSAKLASRGVAVRFEHQSDVFRSEVVQLLLLIAQTVIAIGEGEQRDTNKLLHILLRHPAWGLQPMDLWQIALRRREQSDWLIALTESNSEQIQTIGNWLLWLAGEASYQPLPVMLEYMLGLRSGQHLTSPLRQYYIDSSNQIDSSKNASLHSEYLRGLSAINILLQVCKSLAKNSEASLSDLLQRYELYQELERPLSDSSWFINAEKAVDIMTIHKSKGLEFDAVFIYNATSQDWKPKNKSSNSPANLPLTPHQSHPDEYVRLMYVAATRAKTDLFVYEYTNNNANEPIADFSLTAHIPADVIEVNELPTSIDVLENHMSWPKLPDIELRNVLQPVVQDFRLSPSALTTFLDITRGGPQVFLEEKLLRLPQTQNGYLGHGIAMHKALQYAQNNIDTSGLADIIGVYETTLKQQHLTDAALKQYLHSGPESLTTLFDTYGFTLPQTGQAEIEIYNVRLGTATLGGKIDHLNIEGSTMTISDYKTGKSINNFTTRDQTMVIKAWTYKIQLLFYVLLCRESGRNKNVTDYTLQLINLETETAKKLRIPLEYDPEDLRYLEQLIAAVWRKIQTVDIPDTSHYSQDLEGIKQFEADLISGAI